MIVVTLTDSQVGIIKQALRSEQGRLKEAGYPALSECCDDALSVIRNSELDSHALVV